MSKLGSHTAQASGSTVARHVRAPRLLVTSALLFALVLALGASSAFAGQTRLVTAVFGSAETNPVDPYPLSRDIRSVAADLETHDVYVVDTENRRVEKFDSAGDFLLLFGKEVDRTTGGDVCTAVSGDICQVGVASSAPGGFEEPEFVAVDNSGVFGQQGDVYVSDSKAGLVSKFTSEGVLISSWGDNGEGHEKDGPPNGQLNGANATGPIKGPFLGKKETLGGIAVDPSGKLWVNGTSNAMFEFRPDSSFLTAWESREPHFGSLASGSTGIAVDSEDNIYLGPFKFDSTGLTLGYYGLGGFPSSLTVDAFTSEVYTAEWPGPPNGSVVARFASSCNSKFSTGPICTPAEVLSSSHVLARHVAITLDHTVASNTLYVAEEDPEADGADLPKRVLAFASKIVPDVVTSIAGGFSAGSATLAGSVNPAGIELVGGLEGCRFEWGEHGAGESEPYGHSAPCDKTAAQIESGTSPVEVHASIDGLQQGKIYHFRLVAGNHNQVNQLIDDPTVGLDSVFGPPAIESVSVTGVGDSSATVQTQVDPDNVDTRIRVEYGPEAGLYTSSSIEFDLGSGGTGRAVPVQLSGLSAHTVYHYRVVAENALGEGEQAVVSGDHSFTTQVAAVGFSLPDGRAWELVSPPDKRGAEVQPLPALGMVQASRAGDAVSYVTNFPTEADPAGNVDEGQVLSRRTVDGWVSSDISPAKAAGTTGVKGPGPGDEYRFFTPDLSAGVVQLLGGFVPQLSAEASEQTPYVRNLVPGTCGVSCYRPLVTGVEGYENVPPETTFASSCRVSATASANNNLCGPRFLAASPDLSHVVLSSSAALVEGVPTSKVEVENKESLYEWTEGRLSLVSVLPPNAKGEELPAPLSSGPVFGQRSVVSSALSNDGSRVVWSSYDFVLYVRDMKIGKTVRVGSEKGVQFEAASSDGSRIVYKEEGDLRECILAEYEGALACETSDLSPAAAGERPELIGLTSGASTDASYVYFVANGVLANNGVPVPGAKRGNCNENGGPGFTCNLYVNHNGTIKLVAVISSEDKTTWGSVVSPNSRSDRVSDSGQWFAFVSVGSLTGYDNRDSASGAPDTEVFLYNASGSDGEGSLVCASCNPTGARPHGSVDNNTANESPLFDSQGLFSKEEWISATIPGWTAFHSSQALYQSRYLSDDGRLFFNSVDALVPRDSNGVADVYEYEPAGVGSCTVSSVTFVVGENGCVGLISSGISKDESAFLDANENGDDAFFVSAARLVGADNDSALDLYDARVGGGFAEPSAPPSCEGDACQSPVSAPDDPTPGSLTYSGPGNPGSVSFATVGSKQKSGPLTRAQKLAKALRSCKRVRSKRARNGCVRSARKRYGRANSGSATSKKGRR